MWRDNYLANRMPSTGLLSRAFSPQAAFLIIPPSANTAKVPF
jgi:hypothetical protein